MEGNPLERIAEFLVGYHSVTPLAVPEIDLLFDLIKTRLAASICILSWRAARRGADDPYLGGVVASNSGAAEFLKILLELPREHAQQTFRQICASVGSGISMHPLACDVGIELADLDFRRFRICFVIIVVEDPPQRICAAHRQVRSIGVIVSWLGGDLP